MSGMLGAVLVFFWALLGPLCLALSCLSQDVWAHTCVGSGCMGTHVHVVNPALGGRRAVPPPGSPPGICHSVQKASGGFQGELTRHICVCPVSWKQLQFPVLLGRGAQLVQADLA